MVILCFYIFIENCIFIAKTFTIELTDIYERKLSTTSLLLSNFILFDNMPKINKIQKMWIIKLLKDKGHHDHHLILNI